MNRLRVSLLVYLCCVVGCGEEPPVDPGLGCGAALPFPELMWSAPSIGTTTGGTREAWIEYVRDCNRDTVLALEVEPAGVVEVPESVSIPAGRSRAAFTVVGLAEGTATLTARLFHEPSGDERTATVEVVVAGLDLPACEGTASGELAPGGSVTVASGPLEGAGLALSEGAARDDRYHVDPFDVTVGCGDDLTPDGFFALGPAVTFGPEHARTAREIPLSIPIRLALLPEGAHRGHVEVAYRGLHDEAGRIVPIASPRFAGSAGGGLLTFDAPRLGTYQAVVRADAPTRRTRTFQFRGILGFSMGGSGSGRIGLGNPDRFDFVAPLGGPTDWTWMLEHIRNNHVGGFCTEAERQADPDGCAMGASLSRVPEPTIIHEHAQHFERWWYEDGYDGQGGTFDRDSYISIFRDLAAMFGNPNYDRTADPLAPNITPPGVPDERRALSPTERCALDNQVVIPPFDGTGDPLSGSEGMGFFDDEYNPDGQYPVITFCDGRETDDIGEWNPDAMQTDPIEVVLAVDIDGNGQRDLGEPVIRNGREPFDDIGLDGVRNEDEVSADGAPYDAVTNPDPAGDDFDFQYNPGGTENNWTRDSVDDDPCQPSGPGMAEPFYDVGIDGVLGTRQLAATADLPGGGFDVGEGNGCFDRTRGAQRMIESSPRWLAQHSDDATLEDLDVLADGGIRDLFNWSVMGNVTMAGWAERGLPVRFYNGHRTLHLEPGRTDFDYLRAPWDEIGRYAMVRYGDPDAEERFIRSGDGGHVGTVQQLIDRLRSGLLMMNARWPDGDRRRVTDDRICAEGDRDQCGYVNTFVTEFTASTGRAGPVSIVLPPGYFHEENAGRGYPVVYFLHGYGMSPEDLVALGLLVWADMNTPSVGTERRMQKMILVFPDGRCRNGECLRGTFYTDAPESTPNGAQMQTWLLDLMDWVDGEFRTRDPEAFEVVE